MNYFIWTSKAQEKCSLGVMVKGGLSNFGFHLFMVLENHDWQKHFLFYCFKLMISSYVPKALELNRTSLCHFKKDQVHTQGPWGTPSGASQQRALWYYGLGCPLTLSRSCLCSPSWDELDSQWISSAWLGCMSSISPHLIVCLKTTATYSQKGTLSGLTHEWLS